MKKLTLLSLFVSPLVLASEAYIGTSEFKFDSRHKFDAQMMSGFEFDRIEEIAIANSKAIGLCERKSKEKCVILDSSILFVESMFDLRKMSARSVAVPVSARLKTTPASEK